MSALDRILQEQVPTVMMPLHGVFEPLAVDGHRLIVGSNGVWLEVKRPWLYARQCIAQPLPVAVPYGAVTEVVELLCGTLPKALIERFKKEAALACPVEHGAWITWKASTGEFQYREVKINHASRSRLSLDRPDLEDDECFVLDLHSHGTSRAFFSSTDNKDDKDELVIAGVIGHCDQPVMSHAYRLCLLGHFVTLPI